MIKILSTMRKRTSSGVDLQILQNKFLDQGKTAMNNNELLVLVLGNGRKSVRSETLASRLRGGFAEFGTDVGRGITCGRGIG
jgi:DNA repair protein RadC